MADVKFIISNLNRFYLQMKCFKQFEIIQYLGDAIGDFEVDNLDRFGLDQFVFPNPMYGKW